MSSRIGKCVQKSPHIRSQARVTFVVFALCSYSVKLVLAVAHGSCGGGGSREVSPNCSEADTRPLR